MFEFFVICNCNLYEYRSAPVGCSVWVVFVSEFILEKGEVGFGCEVSFTN